MRVYSQGGTVWSKWSVEDSFLHINGLECLAVINCLKFFLPQTNATILIRSDNRVVVSLINKPRSNKINTLNRLITPLLNLCSLNHWTHLACYIPGNLNTWADSLPRGHAIRSEWILDQQSFQTITQHLLPEIDIFAHPGNAKQPTFGYLSRPPLALIVDALSVNWYAWKTIYLFPPIDLIPICMKKLQTFHGTGLFIAPHLPSAPWWVDFITHCVRLEVQLDVFQWVQGNRVEVQKQTSLITVSKKMHS